MANATGLTVEVANGREVSSVGQPCKMGQGFLLP